MLRTFFLLLALIVLIVIGLVMTGFINLNRSDDGGLAVSTSDVTVGTTTTNVQLPVVRMEDRQVDAPSLVIGSGAQPGSAQPAPAQPNPAAAGQMPPAPGPANPVPGPANSQ